MMKMKSTSFSCLIVAMLVNIIIFNNVDSVQGIPRTRKLSSRHRKQQQRIRTKKGRRKLPGRKTNQGNPNRRKPNKRKPKNANKQDDVNESAQGENKNKDKKTKQDNDNKKEDKNDKNKSSCTTSNNIMARHKNNGDDCQNDESVILDDLSDFPSLTPSTNPSKAPSMFPSKPPSMLPSVVPSPRPSLEPTPETAIFVDEGNEDISLTDTATLVLSLQTDNYPSETTFMMMDYTGSPIWQGGGYSSLGYYESATTVPIGGCYLFTLFDSGGDGLFCGSCTVEGWYKLRYNGVEVASGIGSEIGSFKSDQFGEGC